MAEPHDLLRARRESAALLGFDDVESLSPADTLRCDLISTLRLAIDGEQATVLDGGAADLAKLITATENLIRLLPGRELPKPAPRADDPNDPRRHMWAVYSEMRHRGALAGEGLDGAKLRIERLTAELANKDARIAELEATLAGSVPLPPNAVKLRNDNPSPPPAPSKPAPTPRATGIITDNEPEPWRSFVGGGSRRDPWADNRS
jgi:hypothetical protein